MSLANYLKDIVELYLPKYIALNNVNHNYRFEFLLELIADPADSVIIKNGDPLDENCAILAVNSCRDCALYVKIGNNVALVTDRGVTDVGFIALGRYKSISKIKLYRPITIIINEKIEKLLEAPLTSNQTRVLNAFNRAVVNYQFYNY